MSKSSEIIASIIDFFSMMSGGFFIALLFDVFRSMRKAVRRNNGKNLTITVYLQDLIFLLLSFAVLVLLIYRVNGGCLDWYISLGCILGAVIYYYFAEPIAGKFIFVIFFAIVKVLKIIYMTAYKLAAKLHFREKGKVFMKKSVNFTKKRKKMLKKAGVSEIHNI
ncbi:MAG: hypothetical protein E7384_04240 [Ruminococcaceae bacterium]|nr:hypothetical protein [Oscillospiraceae bacterium]